MRTSNFLTTRDLVRHLIDQSYRHVTMRRIFFVSCTMTFVGSHFVPVMQGTVNKTFGGQMQFLTIIALFLTSLTLALNQFTSFTNLTYDLLVLSTTVETVVTVYYWGLYHYNRDLLYPKNIDQIPLLVDILLHFLPAVALWMELLTTIKLHRVSKKHIYIITLFAISYMFWTEYCFLRNGYYVYPFMSDLDMKEKIFFTFATIIVGCIVYVISVQIHTVYGHVAVAVKRIKDK